MGDSDAEESAAAAEIRSDEEPCEFDASDWRHPEAAREDYKTSEEDLRCRGDKAHHTNSQLWNAQTTFLLDHQTRMAAYKDCFDSLRGLRNPIAHSLGRSVEAVINTERKRLRGVSKCPADVFARMDEVLQHDLNKRRKLQCD